MIKLKTDLKTLRPLQNTGDDYFHDAAVAHALMRAMQMVRDRVRIAQPSSKEICAQFVELAEGTAAEILRTDFGIEDK